MNKNVMWQRISSSKIFDYYVGSNGEVWRRVRSTGANHKVAVYLKTGHASVKVNGREYTVKNLVARYHIRGHRYGDYVECVDGNPLNCKARNLRIYTKKEHGRRTGYLHGRAQQVNVDGAEYPSIRQAAKAMYCSYQTLLDYISGASKVSVLAGRQVQLSMEGGNAI
jgi:hypothetical protein